MRDKRHGIFNPPLAVEFPMPYHEHGLGVVFGSPTMASDMRIPASDRPAARGSDGEFASLFQASFRKLWCIAAGIVGNAATAEDVVQEAAVIALGKFDRFQKHNPPAANIQGGATPPNLPNFTAWMAQIVRYVALNQYRKDRRNHASSLSDGSESAVITANTPPAPVQLTRQGQLPEGQQTFDDRVMRALGQVGDVARACLLLRTIESLDYKQIAQLLEIPEGTAMSHVHRARQLLRQQLAEAEMQTSGTRT